MKNYCQSELVEDYSGLLKFYYMERASTGSAGHQIDNLYF